MHNKSLHMATFLLLVVGGLNWLLVGLLDINLVNMVFGSIPMLERAVYVLVGVSAVYELLIHKGTCSMCKGNSVSSAADSSTGDSMSQRG